MQNNPAMQPEDNLVAMHRKARSKRKRKIAIIAITVALVVFAALIFGVQALRSRVAEEFASSDENEVQTFTVTTGSISTTVSGTGNLSADGVESVDIADTLEILNLYVKAGQAVQQRTMWPPPCTNMARSCCCRWTAIWQRILKPMG